MRGRAAWVAFFFALTAPLPAVAQDLAVIVHLDRSDDVDLDDLAQIYLKRRHYWANGDRIVPVNRDAESSIREAFTRTVFGTSAWQQVVYWNRQYFMGVLPPATLASDEAVKRFVASEPLAIGYIDASAVDTSVRVVLLLKAPVAKPGDASK
jgi:ABC-type phosphate transport system substrate-binding protein